LIPPAFFMVRQAWRVARKRYLIVIGDLEVKILCGP
jgi:hypothetical protein